MAIRTVPALKFGNHYLDKHISRGDKADVKNRWIVNNRGYRNLTLARQAAASFSGLMFDPATEASKVLYDVATGFHRTGKHNRRGHKHVTSHAPELPLEEEVPEIKHADPIVIASPSVPEVKAPSRFTIEIQVDATTSITLRTQDAQDVQDFVNMFG